MEPADDWSAGHRAVFEAGVKPGEVLASMPTGSTAPTFSFWQRRPDRSTCACIRCQAEQGRASSEIRIYVNIPAGPTAPSNLLGVVKARVSDCRGEIPSAAARRPR